ncbi:MAG: 23S rRNA (pseudouridine(1915)-N(3))-methyltransferase RlmH [Lachnospiraceae bacterium]|nr:23S rRNA (pseudouridine(1915)-N(3))-methyltransferase RlmH [Lachnospiraceae bacterium]MDY5742610.1 23S rRNA (pseudouridine(1915)-N(3))-methyltransferase RlmH [Lachnospiraceae bacterium]
MKITLITVGKIKEAYFSQAIAEYSKRLGRYAQLKIEEVPDEKTDENMSLTETERLLEREGRRILDKIPERARVIALAIKGRTYSSEALADHLQGYMIGGESHLVFIIGGSLGLSREVMQRADEALSFSPMTFPHQLMRVILLEQIYRSFRIIRHEPYHK